MLPLSQYLNGFIIGPRPASRARMSRPTYVPSCIAGCATPGSLLSETMSPIAKISGWPGSVQSGLTSTRPARSVAAPVRSASCRASGEAATPAAQMRVRARMVSRLSPVRTVIDVWSMPTAIALSRTSTPIFSSWCWV